MYIFVGFKIGFITLIGLCNREDLTNSKLCLCGFMLMGVQLGLTPVER